LWLDPGLTETEGGVPLEEPTWQTLVELSHYFRERLAEDGGSGGVAPMASRISFPTMFEGHARSAADVKSDHFDGSIRLLGGHALAQAWSRTPRNRQAWPPAQSPQAWPRARPHQPLAWSQPRGEVLPRPLGPGFSGQMPSGPGTTAHTSVAHARANITSRPGQDLDTSCIRVADGAATNASATGRPLRLGWTAKP